MRKWTQNLRKHRNRTQERSPSRIVGKRGRYHHSELCRTIDGVPFDGGTAESQKLEIGSHSFIDTFEDQLVGLNIGDEKMLR